MKDISVYNKLLDTDGKVIRWPGKKKKEERLCILEYLKSKFENGRTYKEKEVNAILEEWHLFNDYALLRREMFEHNFINRTKDCREYWIG